MYRCRLASLTTTLVGPRAGPSYREGAGSKPDGYDRDEPPR